MYDRCVAGHESPVHRHDIAIQSENVTGALQLVVFARHVTSIPIRGIRQFDNSSFPHAITVGSIVAIKRIRSVLTHSSWNVIRANWYWQRPPPNRTGWRSSLGSRTQDCWRALDRSVKRDVEARFCEEQTDRRQKADTYLKSDVIAKAYSREGHEAIVEAIEVAPTLVFRKYRSARCDNYTRQQTSRQHEIHFCSFGFLTSEIRLCLLDHDRRDFIQSLANALEHYQP